MYNCVIQILQKERTRVLGLIELDRKIGADTYENVGVLKEINKIEKLIEKEVSDVPEY